MTGNKRAKDAFFDGFMNKTIKLQTKKKLLAAYGPAFVCQDGNCRGASIVRACVFLTVNAVRLVFSSGHIINSGAKGVQQLS